MKGSTNGRRAKGGTDYRSHAMPTGAQTAAVAAPFEAGAPGESLPDTTPPARCAASSARNTSASSITIDKYARGTMTSSYSEEDEEPCGWRAGCTARRTNSHPDTKIPRTPRPKPATRYSKSRATPTPIVLILEPASACYRAGRQMHAPRSPTPSLQDREHACSSDGTLSALFFYAHRDELTRAGCRAGCCGLDECCEDFRPTTP